MKPRGISRLWNFFKIRNKPNKIALCILCNNKFSYKSTITNLKMHLKQKHAHAYEQLCKMPLRPASMSDSQDNTDFIHSDSDINDDHVDKLDADEVLVSLDGTLEPTFEYVGDVLEETNEPVRNGEECNENPIKAKDGNENDDNIYTQYDVLDESEFKNKDYIKTRSKRLRTTKPNSPSWDNNIDSFSQYIATILKMLPRQTVVRFQVLITQRLAKEQMKYL